MRLCFLITIDSLKGFSFECVFSLQDSDVVPEEELQLLLKEMDESLEAVIERMKVTADDAKAEV